MRRQLYETDHESFRRVVRAFVQREVVGRLEKWEEARLIDRDVWLAAGRQGILGLFVPEKHGGAGVNDFRFRAVVLEELAAVHATSLSSGWSVHDDIVTPYIVHLGTEEQQARWLPKMATANLIGAVAMTEPGTGSDLRGIRTSAAKVDGGWVVTGAKTFITNGINADLIITVARTDPGGGADGFTLLVVEREMPGFTRGRKLDKLGMHAQDTAELHYDEVFVPNENVLGAVGCGFGQLVHHLPMERLSIAVGALAAARSVFNATVTYTNERMAFGQAVGDFQNSRFELADIATKLDVCEAYIDKAMMAWQAGELTSVDAAKAKLWATEMQGQVVDSCLQLHGGYGYMIEYPVARAYQDARVQRIYGGTSEIMRQIIGRDVVGKK